ncbi:hypothetical protein ACJIZ3_023544 [Penstemon smallii]|uniref:Uncharacterized protein n=1 Tax=Penstemon smallii TaxID=265156 RepID=A0ABD3TS96_9LAMI
MCLTYHCYVYFFLYNFECRSLITRSSYKVRHCILMFTNSLIDIKAVSNIFSLLSLKVDHQPMFPPPTVLVEPNSSAVATNKVCNSPRLEESENAKRDVPSLSKFAGSKDVEGPNQKKGLLLMPPLVLVEANSSAVAANKVCNSPRLEESENAKRDVPSSSKSAGSKAVERPNKRKGLLIKEERICSSEKKPVNLALTKFNKSKPAINISKPAIKKSKPAMRNQSLRSRRQSSFTVQLL